MTKNTNAIKIKVFNIFTFSIVTKATIFATFCALYITKIGNGLVYYNSTLTIFKFSNVMRKSFSNHVCRNLAGINK